MGKILINLFSNTVEERMFDYYSNEFLAEYDVFNYYFNIEEIFPEIAEGIVKSITEENNLEIRETQFIFQTNIVDLAFFSNMVYSEILDAVILIDENLEYLTKKVTEYSYMDNIIRNNEVNYRLKNVFNRNILALNKLYIIYLFENELFNSIDDFQNFHINNTEKYRFNFNFLLEEGEFKTIYNLNETYHTKVYSKPRKQVYDINHLVEPYGLLKFINLLIEINLIDDMNKLNLLQTVCHQVKMCKKSEILISLINRYLKEKQVSLDIYLNYMYILLDLGDKKALENAYIYVYNNIYNLNKINVYAFVTNSLFYVSHYNQEVNEEIVKLRLKTMAILKEHFKEAVVIKNTKKLPQNIAIVTGQLLSVNHGPTQLTINYANALKEFNPDLNIKIFVEDYANYSPDDINWNIAFKSSPSSSCRKMHQKLLNKSIAVYYSNSELTRNERIRQDVESIIDFQPQVIFKMGSNYNLTADLLYDFYPIISCTMGGAEDSYCVDIFTGGYPEEVMDKMYNELNIQKQTYISHRTGIYTPKTSKHKFRRDYNLTKNDFVMVTVGNRLGAEISEAFVNEMASLMDSDKSYKWLIVGTEGNEIIASKPNLLNKVIFIPYEENLFELYKICDVYVNPIRKTGGTSAALAMKAKLPIVTTNSKSDVGVFAGENNCIQLDEYSLEIKHLKNDKNYYNEKSLEMFNRIENEFSLKNTVDDLQEIFTRAINKFNERVKGI